MFYGDKRKRWRGDDEGGRRPRREHRAETQNRPVVDGTVVVGRIKKLVTDKGFGFIRSGDGMEYFFHKAECASGVAFENLLEGDRVKFVEQSSPKGPRAIGVELAGSD